MSHQFQSVPLGKTGSYLTELRRKAECSARKNPQLAPEKFDALSQEDAHRLLHELQVHQIELELQNDELRNSQIQLDAARERYFDLYDLAPVGYCTLYPTGMVQEANLTVASMLGVARKTLAGKPFSRFILPQDQDIYYRHNRGLAASGQAQRFELRMIGPDGTPVWTRLDMTVAAVTDKNDAAVYRVVLSDISQRKQAEEEVERKNVQLQKALTERDKFFSIVAHDLRSPFSGFLILLEMLTENIESLDPEEIQMLVGEMQQSSKNLYNLLENLLEWASIQRGVVEYRPAPCSLKKMIRDNVHLLNTIAEQKEVSFQCTVPENLSVLADSAMLNLILRNLMTNGVKFSRNNGTVTVFAEQKAEMIEITVADEGVGMDQDTLAHLFVLGESASRKGTAGEKGTGLGLLLCKEYVEKHGGKLWAHSKEGEGSTFHFTLPASGSGDAA